MITRKVKGREGEGDSDKYGGWREIERETERESERLMGETKRRR